jgi:protein gp37
MSDLFHESIPDEWVDRIFAVMALAPQHTFQVLTKRAERLPGYFSQIHHCGPYTDVITRIAAHTETIAPIRLRKLWPLPNVQLGVSVEDQKTADERIPHLLNTPAAVRFISAEPLLGPIDVERYLDPTGFQCIDPDCVHRYLKFVDEDDYETTSDNDPICRDCGQVGTWTGYERGVDWVIVGGESGHSARPMHPQWARGLRDQCDAAGVSFFFKQWGEYRPFTQAEVDDLSTPGRLVDAYCECGYYCDEAVGHVDHGAFPMRRVGKKKAGRLLDGRTWDEFPNTTEQHDS